MSGALHYVDGVGADTRVRCPNNDGDWFGPHEDADHEPAYCPYCGAESDEGAHWVHDDGREVDCPNSTMSTYRYCPGCGEEAYADE